jgi:hypothetical protein
VADGRDSPANSLADHKSLLLIVLAILAIAGGLALIAGQFVTGRRSHSRYARRPLANRSGVLAAAAAAPVRSGPAEGVADRDAAAPREGASPAEAAPQEEAAPPEEAVAAEGAAPPAADPAPDTNGFRDDDDTADAWGFPSRVPETERSAEAPAEPPVASPAAPRGPAPSHRPAIRPRQATLAGAALTVLGALLSVRRRR